MTTAAVVPEQSAPAPPKPQAAAPAFHIPSLDGVRAVSFLIVFVAHAGLGWIVPGYFGLTLFFFLSGYLITTLLRREYESSGAISLKQFYWRRVLRIFPPFYLVLALAMTATALGAWGGTLTLEAALFQVAHLTNYYIVEHGWWHGLAPGTWVYWSLAIEEHFYLVFPLLYLWLRRRVFSANRQALLLAALCAVVLAWRCVLIFVFDVAKERTYVATDTRVDSILAGCILGIWHNPALPGARTNERALKLLWIPVGLAAVIVSLVVRIPQFEQTFRYTLQSFGLLPLFIAVVRWHDRGLFKLLNLRLVRYVGVLSYSMYLMHTTTLWGFEQRTDLPVFVRGVLALAVLVLLGTLIHYWVERPVARLRRRFSKAA